MRRATAPQSAFSKHHVGKVRLLRGPTTVIGKELELLSRPPSTKGTLTQEEE